MATSDDLVAPPVLSTPAEHLFEDPTPATEPDARPPLPDDVLRELYEIERTAREIVAGRWTRVGLQFPDGMLRDASRVVEALTTDIQRILEEGEKVEESGGYQEASRSQNKKQQLGQATEVQREDAEQVARTTTVQTPPRLYILADTSYSACCVDEIAAEHVSADVVVHYGRSCLSPTARLPVIYVYTKRRLDLDAATVAFAAEFPNLDVKVVVIADITYEHHVAPLVVRLATLGYIHVVGTEVERNPNGLIPNRRLVLESDGDVSTQASTSGVLPDADSLRDYAIFHIATPPSALLLALTSRVKSLHILAIPGDDSSPPSTANPTITTRALLRRRYARVLSLATAGVVGILVNTLSVSNYLASLDLLRRRIAEAGKKSYTIVVGKLNPAKLANFAEVDGWVVVGCWESGLVEDDAGFYRPVVTPFELEVALTPDDERVWGLEWWGGIEKLKLDVTEGAETFAHKGVERSRVVPSGEEGVPTDEIKPSTPEVDDGVEGEESAPPEFDLRTGRLVSHSRPMRVAQRPGPARGVDQEAKDDKPRSVVDVGALIKHTVGELAMVNGVASPGAEFLRSQRTWQGLGSDFESQEDRSTVVEEGRSGVARGYTVGEDQARH